MASFIHITMPFMLLGKPMVSRLGAARTKGLGWFIRYASALIILSAPAIAPFTHQGIVTTIILFGAFGFAVFRTVGMSADSPLIGEVAEPDTRGEFLSMIQMRNQFTYLLAMAVIILILKYVDELWVYQAIIGTGCVVGFYASTVVGQVPESRAPRHSAQKSFPAIFRNLWSSPHERRLLFAWISGMISIAILIPFMMIAVKNGYDISDYAALLFALVLVLGGLASGFINRNIGDILGGGRLLKLYVFGMILTATCWMFAPEQFSPLFTTFTFLLGGFCHIGIVIGLNLHFFEVVSESDRVGSSLILNIIAGAAAGLAGSVIGGGLLKLLSYITLERLDIYRHYFLIVALILGLLLLSVSRLMNKDHRDNAPMASSDGTH